MCAMMSEEKAKAAIAAGAKDDTANIPKPKKK